MNHLAAFQDGLRAAKAGKKMIARIQFEQVAESNPDFIHGWLWLAWTANSPQQAQDFLMKAEKLDPNHRLTSLFREVVASLAHYEIDADATKTVQDEDLYSQTNSRHLGACDEVMDSPNLPSAHARETMLSDCSDVGCLRDDTQDEEDKLAEDFGELGDDLQAAISVAAVPHRTNTIEAERAESESDTAEPGLEDDKSADDSCGGR